MIRKTLFALGLAAAATAAQAEERMMDAVAAWQGSGTVHVVGEDSAFFIGSFEGVMFVETEGSMDLEASALTCPASFDITPSTGATQGSGHCIIGTLNGDVVYARWSCQGTQGEGCSGDFELTGGSGGFAGITGSGPFKLRSALRAIVIDAQDGDVGQAALGVATWSGFKYTVK